MEPKAALLIVATAWMTAGCAGPPPEPPEIRIPLAAEMRGEMSAPFVIPANAVYTVGLEFTTPIQNADVAQLVVKAASVEGQHMPFDLTWTVLDGTQAVGRGSGVDGISGAGEGGSGMTAVAILPGKTSPRAPMPTTKTLYFGTFDGCAGRAYTLKFSHGPDLAAVLRSSPTIAIDVHRTLSFDGVVDDGPRLKAVCGKR